MHSKIFLAFLFGLFFLSASAQATDLSLTKKALSSDGKTLFEVAPGTEFFYELFVKDSQEGVEGIGGFFTDVFPAELEVLKVTADRGLCAIDAQTVTCDFGGISDGESIRILITAKLRTDAPLGTTVSNTAAVTAGNEINPANNEATAEFEVAAETITDPDMDSGGCSLRHEARETRVWKAFRRLFPH